MGTRGPQPEPGKLKLIKGTGDDSNEPKPLDEDPVRPSDLGKDETVIWNHVVRHMGATRVIRAVDRDMLRMYCEAVVRYQKAHRRLVRTGPLLKGEHGGLVKNPLHQIVRDNAELARRFARELGLTPAARVGLSTPDAPPKTRTVVEQILS